MVLVLLKGGNAGAVHGTAPASGYVGTGRERSGAERELLNVEGDPGRVSARPRHNKFTVHIT